jgi:hypothetical protein
MVHKPGGESQKFKMAPVTTRIVTVINMTWNGRDTCDRTVEEKSSPVIPSRKGKQADQTQTRNSTKVS